MENVNFEKIYNKVKKATLKYFKEWREKEEKEEIALSKKGKSILNYIFKEGFGCYTQRVINLVSLIIDENLGHSSTKYKLFLNGTPKNIPPENVVFVLDSVPNCHDYGVGTPVLKWGKTDKALRADGSKGNHLPDAKVYYPPTEEEFNDFMDSLKKK